MCRGAWPVGARGDAALGGGQRSGRGLVSPSLLPALSGDIFNARKTGEVDAAPSGDTGARRPSCLSPLPLAGCVTLGKVVGCSGLSHCAEGHLSTASLHNNINATCHFTFPAKNAFHLSCALAFLSCFLFYFLYLRLKTSAQFYFYPGQRLSHRGGWCVTGVSPPRPRTEVASTSPSRTRGSARCSETRAH